MPQEKFSDRGYKMLFSHPRMVEDLLRSFVHEDFVREFDFTTLKKMPGSYVTGDFRQRESDIVWEVHVADRSAYIYILIEFQSTIDPFMSLRLLTYILLFYQDLLKQRKEPRLPAVFPIVLYNGEQTWTATQDLETLIDSPFPSIRRYIPHFHYYKIAENEFSPESLIELQGLVSSVFLLETTDVQQFDEIIGRILAIYQKEASPELKRDFLLWLRRILSSHGIEAEIASLDESEVRPMLSANLKKYREEGEAKGRAEGQRSLVKLLLESKFGEASRILETRVEAETDAQKLEEVVRLVALGHGLDEVRQNVWPEGPGQER